jgi:hypothetical protein
LTEITLCVCSFHLWFCPPQHAGWRELLRKKVEERCVALEANVGRLTADNSSMTQALQECVHAPVLVFYITPVLFYMILPPRPPHPPTAHRPWVLGSVTAKNRR